MDKKDNGLETDATLLRVSICMYIFFLTKSAQSISWAVSVKYLMFLLGFGGETFIPGEDPGRAESWGQASQFHPQKSNHCPVCRGGEVYYSHKYPSVYLVFWTLITIFIDIYSGQLIWFNKLCTLFWMHGWVRTLTWMCKTSVSSYFSCTTILFC